MTLAQRIWIVFDRATLVAIAAGIALELQPFWSAGLRVGFLVTLAAVVLQIVSSHVVAPTSATTSPSASAKTSATTSPSASATTSET